MSATWSRFLSLTMASSWLLAGRAGPLALALVACSGASPTNAAKDDGGAGRGDEVGDAASGTPINDGASDAGGGIPINDGAAQPAIVCGGKQSSSGIPMTAASCANNQVFIPGGSFMMGTSQYKGGYVDEEPVHKVNLSPYCIDITEVTVAAYNECIEAGQCTKPSSLGYPTWGTAGREQYPINNVTWAQASTYCSWTGGSLPTEAQWEFAARGPDGLTYPWGNELPVKHADRFNDCSQRFDLQTSVMTCPTAVGSYPAGASPFGLLDMAGNLEEWVADAYTWYSAQEETDPVCQSGDNVADRVARGPVQHCSRSSGCSDDYRASNRLFDYPDVGMDYRGFRCARATSTAGSGGSTTGSGGAAGSGGSTTGSGGAAGGGGSTTSSGGTSGSGTFSPLCSGLTTAVGVAPTQNGLCTDADPQLCYETCGPESKGFKSETCTAGVYIEQSGCSFPAGDYACYRIPTADDPTCPTTAPQASTACSVAACVVCGVSTGYLDSSGASKTGYCVCAASSIGSGKWSCASKNAWPCPAGSGC